MKEKNDNKGLDPIYLFHNGVNYEAYKLLSPHKEKRDGEDGWVLRTYAPSALSVSAVGDFNDWNREKGSMKRIADGSIWEVFICGAKVYDSYKFSIESKNKKIILKCDPYALHAETPPANASKLYDVSGFCWKDEKWLKQREITDTYKSPLNIYEVHLGSWKRYDDGNFYNYSKFSEEIIPYVKKMGYTHIELLPITEFPFDGSWGYQVTGMFAPTSRFGTPHDFMALVNDCHANGIGVIIDWVPAHFPRDEHGLACYDGTKLYEYDSEWKGQHKSWGTLVYDYEKKEVQSFLISSANMWLKEYHIDGIRVDAVASMLYLNYDRREGEWQQNKYGNEINIEACDFFKHLNSVVLTANKGVITIAEESTSFPKITKPPFDGGLGFNYKWNMGWMNDTLKYASMDPFFRKDNHNKLTFSLVYAYDENFILPFSHDEVVHGKASLLTKMPGYYDDKFKALKALLGYQISFVGKKLNFMGSEIAQFIEWKFAEPLEWFLLEYEPHRLFHEYVAALNKYYLKNKPLYELDYDPKGFKWVVVDDNVNNIIAYKRVDSEENYILTVINFSPVERADYRIGVQNGKYSLDFSSELTEFGGKLIKNTIYHSQKGQINGYEDYIQLNIPANSILFIKTNKKGRRK